MAKDWKLGMRRLEAGIYSDGAGTMHLDIEELLIGNGYAPTPENIETIAAMWEREGPQLLAGLGRGSDVPIVVEMD